MPPSRIQVDVIWRNVLELADLIGMGPYTGYGLRRGEGSLVLYERAWQRPARVVTLDEIDRYIYATVARRRYRWNYIASLYILFHGLQGLPLLGSAHDELADDEVVDEPQTVSRPTVWDHLEEA